jgi:hypothetical protein
MWSLGSRQTLSGCLNGYSPMSLGNDVDDNNRQGLREAVGLVPLRLLANRGPLRPTNR